MCIRDSDKISRFIDVTTKVMAIDDAMKEGATALFDEKYGDMVRMVSIGDYSKEFCGGTHVKNIGQIGLFKILSESGIASGVRRIEAITGQGVLKKLNDDEDVINRTAGVLKKMCIRDSTYDTAIMDLRAGRVDVIAVDQVLGEYTNNNLGGEMKECTYSLGDDYYVIGFAKDNTDLRDSVNDAIQALIEMCIRDRPWESRPSSRP